MQFLGPHSWPTYRKFWEWSQAIYGVISPPGDSDPNSLRAAVLDQHFLLSLTHRDCLESFKKYWWLHLYPGDRLHWPGGVGWAKDENHYSRMIFEEYTPSPVFHENRFSVASVALNNCLKAMGVMKFHVLSTFLSLSNGINHPALQRVKIR